jgi:hypothetical protein
MKKVNNYEKQSKNVTVGWRFVRATKKAEQIHNGSWALVTRDHNKLRVLSGRTSGQTVVL